MTAGSIVAGLTEGVSREETRRLESGSHDRGEPESVAPSDPGPVDRRQLKAQAKQAARQERAEAKEAARLERQAAEEAKLDAKQRARQERAEAKEQAAAAKARHRADAAATKAAAMVDARTAALESPELSPGVDERTVQPPAEVPEPQPVAPSEAALADAARLAREREETERDRAEAEDRAHDARAETEGPDAKQEARRRREEAKATLRREREQGRNHAREAKQALRRERDAAKDAAARERTEAKQTARRERGEAQAVSGRAARRAAKHDDRIVEAPREPKVSFLERRHQKSAPKSAGSPRPGPTDRAGHRRGIALLAGLLGALGLICSVILAIGALLVALGAGAGNGAYDLVSSICDALVGPLRDVFSFSGVNADMKEALVAWGLGSMGYLLVGLFAQSFLRSRIDE
jgi:hypothetical protein